MVWVDDNDGVVGGVARDPMFVVCCVINNNLNYEVI